MEDKMKKSLFPIGGEFKSENFSGAVWLNMLTGEDCPVANVTFEPGCVNNWHEHMGGQILLVTAGRGWYQAEGGEARELFPGEVVEIPAHKRHWHGAARDSWFSHLAIEIHPEKGPAVWMEPVDRGIYNQLR